MEYYKGMEMKFSQRGLRFGNLLQLAFKTEVI